MGVPCGCFAFSWGCWSTYQPLPSAAQTQIANADRVSRLGAPKYFFDIRTQDFSVALYSPGYVS